MSSTLRSRAARAVAGSAVVVSVLVVAAGQAGASGLTITKLSPSSVTVTANGATATTTISYSGTPTFPVTATFTPSSTCTTSSFTCRAGSKTFSSGSGSLKFSPLGCGGALTSNFTGTWNVTLKDSAGQTSAPVTFTFTCVAGSRASFLAGNNSGTTFITSGLSDTPYGVSLSPTVAANGTVNNRANCSYDSATGGDFIYTYLIHSTEQVTKLNMSQGEPGILPDGSTTLALFTSGGNIETNSTDLNTASGTGQILLDPTTAYSFGAITDPNGGGVPLSTLLYKGGKSGTWSGGYLCFRNGTTVTNHWDFSVTFTKTAVGAGNSQGFKWSIVNTNGTPTNTF